MVARFRRVLCLVLATSLITMSMPMSAMADIFQLPEIAVVSSTNPGQLEDYDVVWREGWGNDPLPRFKLFVPTADTGQPAIVGAHYYINRPGSSVATMTYSQWPQSYNAMISAATEWDLSIDIPSEVAAPGPLFNITGVPWTPPASAVITRPYEGPFETWFQYFAHDTTTAASGAFAYGLDLTPPKKVETFTAEPAFGNSVIGEWLTQSRVILKWDENTRYDELSGTGYFEVFLDGQPYPLNQGSDTSRRVYDLREHYPGYGFAINTKRQMSIEDLPAGVHTLQVRAVDRATNPGPLSNPRTIKVDPDFPTISITAPAVPGEAMGARPTFSADVTDLGGVAEVGFYLDGMLVTTDTVAPFEVTAPLPLLDGSEHTLRVVAVDMARRESHADKLFVVDNQPTVSVLSPALGSGTFGRLLPVRAAVSDKTAIADVVFRVDGVEVARFQPGSGLSAGTTSTVLSANVFVSPGPHTLDITATNDYGGIANSVTPFAVDSGLRPNLDVFRTATDVSAGSISLVSQWFNTPYPQFTASPDASLPDAVEMLYTADRSPMTAVNPLTPWLYDTSYRVDDASTHFDGVIDQNGIYLSDPLLSGALQMPGTITDHLEGIWYTHAVMRDAAGNSGGTTHAVYGIDRTAPSPVSGVTVFRDSQGTPAVGWLDQTRAVIRWDQSERDALSGTDHYKVLINHATGVRTIEERVAFQAGRTGPMSLTIEDLLPGVHSVTVIAVDRAGNESAPSAPALVRIPSVPRVTITSPASVGATLTSPAPLRANVADDAGIDRVVISIAGTALSQTFTPASADATTLACFMYAVLPTGAHTMDVTAHSISGPSTTVSRTFNVDASLPPDIIDPPDGGGDGPSVSTPFRWFRTAFPTFEAQPSTVPTDPTELLYLVDRSPETLIDTTDPNSYYASFSIDDMKPHVQGVIDQHGVYRSSPVAFDGATIFPGRTTSPLEGIWYIHAAARNALGEGGPTRHLGYGVDLTPPLAVAGVAAYKDIMSTVPLTTWADQSRVVIRWNGGERDRLSGIEYYKVYIDGAPFDGDGLVPFQAGRAQMSLTIEDLASGLHQVQISAIDKAGNESALSPAVAVGVDAKAPTVEIQEPGAGQVVGKAPGFMALAADDGGIKTIEFFVDGTKVGEAWPTPTALTHTAIITPNLSAYPAGMRTLMVVVTDFVGHKSQKTQTFLLDKTAPTLSVTSAGSTPFYPRKRDKYRDDFTIRFKTNETVVARVTVKNSKGKTVRTFTKTVPAGAGSVVWNGKSTTGAVKAGKYRWSLQLTDAAGNNSVVRTGRTEIRTFQVKRLSSGSVRIIQR